MLYKLSEMCYNIITGSSAEFFEKLQCPRILSESLNIKVKEVRLK